MPDQPIHAVDDARAAVLLYLALAPDDMVAYTLGACASQLGMRAGATPLEAIQAMIDEGAFVIDGWDPETVRRQTNNYRAVYAGAAIVTQQKRPQG